MQYLKRLGPYFERDSYLYSLLFLIALLITFIFRPDAPQMMTNYRLNWMVDQAATNFLNFKKTGAEFTHINPNINIGAHRLYYLYWEFFKFENLANSTNYFNRVPTGFYHAINCIILLGTSVFYYNLSLWLGRRLASLFTCFLVLTPIFRFIVLNIDIYAFPFYALGAVFGLAYSCLYCEGRQRYFLAIPNALFLVFLSFFRDTGLFFSFGLLILPIYILYKDRKFGINAAYPVILFLSLQVGLKLVESQYPPKDKASWHATYVGLFEFGGRAYKNAVFLPDFVPIDPAMGNYNKLTGWNDLIAFETAKAAGEERIYSNNYDRIMKEYALNIMMKYPFEALTLIPKRLWNMATLAPWASYTHDSQIVDTLENDVFKIIFLLVSGIGIYFMIKTNARKEALLLVLGLPSCIGPLVVHSGYLMYNFPLFVFGQMSFFIFCALIYKNQRN